MVNGSPIYFYKTKNLSNLRPNSLIAVKADGDAYFELWVTDKTGIPYPIKDETGGGGGGTITAIQNTDGNLEITGTTTKTINVSPSLLSLINSALQSGDNVSELSNDAGYITLADIPTFNPTDYDLEDFTNTSADPFIRTSDLGGAVDSVNGQTGVVVLDSDDISEGTTNLYFTDARALGAIPDATPTVKGIAKLYTSLGSNTDGAVDQNTVNSALSAKANAPLIDTVSSSALTGVTTEGILKSYLIPANTLTASEIINFANDLYKTGTAGAVTSRLYTNTTASLSGASLLATNISSAGHKKISLRRQLVLKGGNIEVLIATQALPDDNLNSSNVASLIAFNPAVDNYFITTAQNASTGDITIQNNLKIHF